jgi:hypothetical protein
VDVVPNTARRGISRFIVMAMLQAARARRLGLAPDSAYSWGLNRAIFFAAAKQGFRGGGSASGGGGEEGRPSGAEEHPNREPYRLGDEFAFRDATQSKLYFTIGDETQTEKEFERQIEARFGTRKNFESAWREAEAIVADADPRSLESGREFYARVYKPRRDELKDKWTELVLGAAAPADSK